MLSCGRCCHRYIVKEWERGFRENTTHIFFHGNPTWYSKFSRGSHSFNIQILTSPWKGGWELTSRQHFSVHQLDRGISCFPKSLCCPYICLHAHPPLHKSMARRRWVEKWQNSAGASSPSTASSFVSPFHSQPPHFTSYFPTLWYVLEQVRE